MIFLPLTLEIGVMQERVASPLMWTVQAPHKAIPHPNFVPVMFRVSRNTQSNGMSGLTSTVCAFPFSVKLMAMGSSYSRCISYNNRGMIENRRNIDHRLLLGPISGADGKAADSFSGGRENGVEDRGCGGRDAGFADAAGAFVVLDDVDFDDGRGFVHAEDFVV